MYAVFHPRPSMSVEVATSSASDPRGKFPISVRASRRMIYPEPVHHATPRASLMGSMTWTKKFKLWARGSETGVL